MDTASLVIATHLPTQVLNVTLGGTNLEGLLFGSLKVLLLADVGHEGDHFISLFLKIDQSVPQRPHFDLHRLQWLLLTKRYLRMQLVSRPPE